MNYDHNEVEWEEEEDEEEDGEEEDDVDSEKNEHFNLQQFGISQALPVAEGEPDWDSGPPDSAEEYLRRVRYEASRIPAVVRVEFDASKHPQGASAEPTTESGNQQQLTTSVLSGEDSYDCQGWAQPDVNWARQFMGDFRQLRTRLADWSLSTPMAKARKLPAASDRAGWHRLCFGKASQEDQQAAASQEHSKESNGGSELDRLVQPLLGTVLALDQVTINALLEMHVEELCGEDWEEEEDDKGSRNRQGGGGSAKSEASGTQQGKAAAPAVAAAATPQAAAATAAGGQQGGRAARALTHQRVAWLFALSAVLAKPLLPDACAAYRSLLRLALAQRAGLRQEDSSEVLPRLNLLVLIAGAYFGQDEQLCRLLPGDYA